MIKNVYYLSYGDLKRLIPGEGIIIRILIKGETILKCLENSVCKYPALEGRYAMVIRKYKKFILN